MTVVPEIVRLIDHYGLPEEVLDVILRKIYSWTPPKVDDQGYVISKVKNIHQCPCRMTLDNVDFDTYAIAENIALKPVLNYYERRVCLWKSEYYDTPPATLSCVPGITRWIAPVVDASGWTRHGLLQDVDRRSEEWIGYRSWLHTHPTFLKNDFRWFRKKSTVLTDHWFKYELALAYPTLYGKKGWANKQINK